MYEYVAHIAVFDDARRLIARMPSMPDAFRQSVERYPAFGRAALLATLPG